MPGRSVGEGPPLRSLDEIDKPLVMLATEQRKVGEVPVSPAATELVRCLRIVGAFDKNNYRVDQPTSPSQLFEVEE